MLAWLLHHFRCGAMARNRFLAYSISPAMLSSQKMITFPLKEAYSAATLATGRLRSLRRYITATVQKSHWLGHPASRTEPHSYGRACEIVPCGPWEPSQWRARWRAHTHARKILLQTSAGILPTNLPLLR